MSLNATSFIETCVTATETLNFGVFLSRSLVAKLIVILKGAFLQEKNIAVLKTLVENAQAQDLRFSNDEIEVVMQNTTKPYLCNEFINTIGDYFDEGSCTEEDLQSEFVMQLCTQFNKVLSSVTTKESHDDSCVEKKSAVNKKHI